MLNEINLVLSEIEKEINILREKDLKGEITEEELLLLKKLEQDKKDLNENVFDEL